MAELNFHDKKFNFEQLLTFGFHQSGTHYRYQVPIVNGQFSLTFDVRNDHQLTTKVVDTTTNDEYVLHLAPYASGTFVGQVANEYQQWLTKLETTCMDADVFKAPQARSVIDYVQATYGDQLEFLWKKFPKNAVWRRIDTHKWYAALLTVKRSKLGLTGDTEITVLDVRATPEDVTQLVDSVHYFPGYHMNKKNWITIILDDSVPLTTITPRVGASYQLAK
ncbi:hypothetical protein D1831_10515 [Lactiplantibacillus garii]|uniref:MmcQ family protein n=1 Tax=Lactiplantibacillus garii TaxID=2306423 RepID=A0A3R8J6R0_9LACO|nr:MmcQ/YjbR family DNA-binding protein [Lactiplantibacillus garii]RRK09851.1 hypothetical protein D1831_10515 [Lactiplantibacillus garii]